MAYSSPWLKFFLSAAFAARLTSILLFTNECLFSKFSQVKVKILGQQTTENRFAELIFMASGYGFG